MRFILGITLAILALGINAQHIGFESTSTRKDTCMILHGVLWDYAKYTLRPESDVALTHLKNFLIDHPEIIVEVGVHSDSRGSKHYSTRLTQRRAESIKQWLTDNGIRDDRVLARGYEENKLLISDMEISKLKTPEEKEKAHQRNRRVEIKILTNDFFPTPVK